MYEKKEDKNDDLVNKKDNSSYFLNDKTGRLVALALELMFLKQVIEARTSGLMKPKKLMTSNIWQKKKMIATFF